MNHHKHHRSLTSNGLSAPNDVSSQLFSTTFSSADGYRILSNVISDEYKLLEETKKILEKRLALDEQYARNLQDLTASADRVAWPVNTHPIASVRQCFVDEIMCVFVRWILGDT